MPMFVKSRIVFVCILFFAFIHMSFATDLMDIYHQAAYNDPLFQAAHGTYFSNKEMIPQAQANLLPVLLANNTLSKETNNGDPNQIISGGNQSVNLNDFSISATQPIFNYQYWMQFKQAKDSVKSAEATYNAAAQNLMIRVGQAYLAVLQAKDNLRFAQAQKRMYERQMKEAQQRYNVGLNTMTDVYQAQSAYDAMVAQEMSYKNILFIQFENLRTLTNQGYASVAPLKQNTVPLIKPVPADSKVWVDKAIHQNYILLSAQYAKDAARVNIQSQQAGHYPTVGFQGTYNNLQDNANASDSSPAGSNSNIGITVSLPLYQGGLISSQTRQAEYQYETAAANFQSAYLNTMVNTKNAYNTLIVSISQIKADKRAVLSAQNSVNSTEAQFHVGTATMVDVLNTQQQLYRALTQKTTDQYTYMNAILALKLAAGTLSVSDLEELNTWLDKNPQHAVYDNEQIE